MIIIEPLLVISSTIPIVDYNPPNKYVFDNDYSEFSLKYEKSVDPLTEFLYKSLIEEINKEDKKWIDSD